MSIYIRSSKIIIHWFLSTYIKKVKPYGLNKKIDLDSLTENNIDIFNKEINSRPGIDETYHSLAISNKVETNKINTCTVGYMGDARESRGSPI